MKGKKPWADWIPGVLSLGQVSKLIEEGYLSVDKKYPGDLDHSAIDLTLSAECWELPSGSVKPFGDRYLHLIKQMKLIKEVERNESGEFSLNQKTTYLIKLNENISPLKNTPIYGQATAKSSIGRMDVLARLIVDGMTTYEGFEPAKIGNGAMYLEVTPMTFNVRVKQGISLSQLRLFKGSPSDCEIKSAELFKTVIINEPSDDGSLSLNACAVKINNEQVSAFCSKKMEANNEYISLWGVNHVDPEKHWDLVKSDKNDRIRIESSKFFIMRSHEKIAVPKGIAVYCKAIDETIGEMRIHYAGFAHPYFGYNQQEEPVGTPLVFEVRGHDVNVSLGDREKMARLVFYRMSEDASLKEKPIDDQDPYQHQDLQLSKFFKAWKK